MVTQRAFSCSSVASAVACVTFAPCVMAQPCRNGGADAIQLVAQVQEAESRRESDVHRLVSTRKYVLKNKRWEKDAIMHARVTWEAGTGKQFEVLKTENAEGLQKRVFEKLIEGEIEASRKSSQGSDTAVTSANYDFAMMGAEMLNGRECLVVHLKPKRGSKYLIDGKAWIDANENAIVRVEGRTSKSVSFWIGKPYIIQDFRKVGDVWVSASNRSTSDVKLLGRTELYVDFVNYQVGACMRSLKPSVPSRKRISPAHL